jgi:interferon, gamma-inducible protein 30
LLSHFLYPTNSSPDCKLFVQEQLTKTYELLGERVMDLQYVPFGNARINETTKQVICQHGPAECDANLYQECAIGVYPETQRHLPFMSCLDSVLPMGYHDEPFDTAVFETCANTTGLSFHRIKACHDIPQVAWSLITRAARATPSYHKYVPWVELDGAPIDVDDGELLITKICAVFKKAGGWDPVCDVQ